MSHLKFTTTLEAAILVAALAGCSSSSTTPGNTTPAVSDQQVSNDAASVTAPDAAGDAQQFNDEGQFGTNFSAMTGIALPGSGAPATMQTACGPSTTVELILAFGANLQDTVQYNRTREFFADGACATAWSPSVDSIEYVGTWDENLSDVSGNWTQAVNRVRNATVMGVPTLDSATSHVWNAHALVNDTIHFVGPVNTRNYAGIAYDTATAVTFNHPRAGEVYPESGTWTRWATWNLTVTGAKTENATIQRHILVTFANGQRDVMLQVLNVGTGQVVLTCQLDLKTHRIVPGSCH
jgi:hypothetical protein